GLYFKVDCSRRARGPNHRIYNRRNLDYPQPDNRNGDSWRTATDADRAKGQAYFRILQIGHTKVVPASKNRLVVFLLNRAAFHSGSIFHDKIEARVGTGFAS